MMAQAPAVLKGDTVETVLAKLKTRVKVALEICNESKYKLKKKMTFLESGVDAYAPHGDINPGETCACGFCKHQIGMCGCFGVLSYSIEGENMYLNIMFCNPHSGVIYNREMAIQFKTAQYDIVPAKLLTEMYESKESSEYFQKTNAGPTSVTITNDKLKLKVTGTMLNDEGSIIRVHLTDIPTVVISA